MFTKTFFVAGLATMANAHIKMTSPVPYGDDTLNNSPLDASGSDFPCKQRPGVYASGASNVFEQGSKQQLAFMGTAVHGGGSCQVSVTTDLEPTKDSVWKVIKSIEGGCPAQDTTGNLGNSANAEVPFKYDFTVPDELAAGNYTMAWTWFNKVGNREMYMNCAPMKVTGSGGSDEFMDTLPDMFVANIGNGCQVESGKDAKFPNPGKNVEKLNGKTNDFYMPTGASCGKPTGGSGGDGGSTPTTDAGSEPTSASASTPAPTTATSASEDDGSASKTVPGGVFITQDPSLPMKSEPASNGSVTTSARLEPTTAPTEPAPTSTAPVPAPGNSTGGTEAGSPCSNEGEWNCIGGTAFQRCASGMWSPVMQMAAGVECNAGMSSQLKMHAINARRQMRHAFRM